LPRSDDDVPFLITNEGRVKSQFPEFRYYFRLIFVPHEVSCSRFCINDAKVAERTNQQVRTVNRKHGPHVCAETLTRQAMNGIGIQGQKSRNYFFLFLN